MTATSRPISSIPALDGIRGYLAIWVLLSHVTQFVNGPRGLIDRGGIAVDLFMFVSGFLMFWNIENRRHKEPPHLLSTWQKFFIRRIFRIAPLYYIALVPALFFNKQWKVALSDIYTNQGIDFLRPFESECSRTAGTDILSHLTFTFGLHPCYSASNVIPDWSLSLEMQFYFCFPLLFLLMRKWHPIFYAIIVASIVGLSTQLISTYVIDTAKIISFPQPSLLVLRLNCFLAGMLLARIACDRKINLIDLTALALSLLLFQRATFTAISVVMSAMLLGPKISNDRIGAKIKSVLADSTKIFDNRAGRTLGELSYGVYLLHIFILIPLVKSFQTTGWFLHLSGGERFLLIAGTLIPLVLLVAKAASLLIEKPFISIGRTLSRGAST